MGKGTNKSVESKDDLLLTKKTNNKKKNTKKKDFPIFTTFCVAVGLLLAFFITMSVLDSTNFWTKQKLVLKVGDTTVNAVEFSYAYGMMRNMYTQYGLLDAQTDVKTTKCTLDQTKTWAEYFTQSALESLKGTLYQYNDAIKNGVNLSEESNKSYDDFLVQIDDVCKQNKVDRSFFFARTYMNGFGQKEYDKMSKISLLASQYNEEVTNKFVYNADQKETYYNENKSEFDKYDYRINSFPYIVETTDNTETKDVDETVTAEAAAASKEKAKADSDAFLAKITDEKSFKDSAFVRLSEDEQSKNKEAFAAGTYDPTLKLQQEYSDNATNNWLADSSRVKGEKAVVDDAKTNSFNVIYFLNAARLNYKLASMKHIQFNIEQLDQTTTASLSEEEKAAKKEENKAIAKAKADEVLAKFEATDKSETEFVKLIPDNSADTATVTTEGLVENIKKSDKTSSSETSKAFDEWIFASDRKAGDYTLMQTSDTEYEIMFFIGLGEECWSFEAGTKMKTNATNEYMKNLEAQYKDTIIVDSEVAKLVYKAA